MASRRARRDKPRAPARAGGSQPAARASYDLVLGQARRAALAGEADAAIPLYIEAISRGCALPSAFNDLGALLAQSGRIAAAVIQLEIALTLDPAASDIRANLSHALDIAGTEAFQAGQWKDAAAAYCRQVEIDGPATTAYSNAGVACLKAGDAARALPYFRHVATVNPESAGAHFQLGLALFILNERDCEGAFRRAVELDPRHVEAHVNLGIVYNRLSRLGLAKEQLSEALRLDPQHAEAHSNAAAIHRDQGEIPLSLEHYRRALVANPHSPSIFSDYLLTRQADPAASGGDLLADHLAWNARFAAAVDRGDGVGAPSYSGGDSGRRLRIGYVSADLRTHSVATFIEPILNAHDRARFHITCYFSGIADAVTRRIRSDARPDAWHDVRGWTDEALAARIAADEIDVLVDLGGHTADNRLLTFARRSAPVQVTYCGYPGTTGLAAMDWRLTDGIADPPGPADAAHTERLWRLPHGFLCFRPDPDFPAVAPSPAATQGFTTYGCFNNLSKVGDLVLDAWAEILRAVPESRLFLKARGLSDAGPRDRLRAAFDRLGIGVERILFAPYAASSAEHVGHYAQVDVALDPFPYNGTTTTCEALWMGVPVVTVAGERHAGRVGASILTAIGHPELIAPDIGGYVQRAAALAHDDARLNDYRRNLRSDMAASALMSAATITRDIEEAYEAVCRQATGRASVRARSDPRSD